MAESIKIAYISLLASIKSIFSSYNQTMILGLSSSLTAGAAYSYIVSLDYRYFTPALGIVGGLIGGLGIAARDIFSEKYKNDNDIPLKNLTTYIVFGIISLFLGYIFVYYFVKIPASDVHGALVLPSQQGTIYFFLGKTMNIYDIIGAVFGSICTSAIPVNLKKFKNLIKNLRF